jgi:uncharacterized protein (DUF924 family)
MSSPESPQGILYFWFGPKPYSRATVAQHGRFWFDSPAAPELMPQTDELIRERFAPTLQAAQLGALRSWESSPRRRLALILVLDQFSRHCYRGSAAAYAQDQAALSLSVSGMQFGADAALDPLERVFFYMPLQHAESLEVQDESVAAFRRLLGEAPAELRGVFESSLSAAVEHRYLIERFGRFPDRNAALGRESEDREQDWLASEGQRFVGS